MLLVDVKALDGVELLLPEAPGCPKVVFSTQTKVVCCGFLQLFASSSSIIAFVADTLRLFVARFWLADVG